MEEIYSPIVGFLAGWIRTLVFYPAMISALAVAFAHKAALFVGFMIPIAVGYFS